MNIKELYNESEIISIESYLNKHGITDIQEYFNPTDKYLESPMKYKNMLEGVQLFKYHYLKESIVYIIFDSDVDGYTSGVIIYKYMKLLNSNWNIKILIHNKKERGLDDELLFNKIMEEKPNLLIIPDANTNCVEPTRKVFENGTDVLTIDHHSIETAIDCGVLISNQFNDDCDKE